MPADKLQPPAEAWSSQEEKPGRGRSDVLSSEAEVGLAYSYRGRPNGMDAQTAGEHEEEGKELERPASGFSSSPAPLAICFSYICSKIGQEL